MAQGSCEKFFCTGDAIECEIARGVWQHRCVNEWMEKPNEFSEAFAQAKNETSEPSVTDKDVSGLFQQHNYISGSVSCPADWSVQAFGKTISVSLSWLCQYLGVVRAIFQSMAWLFVLGLLIKET
jgi:hypothetical protein